VAPAIHPAYTSETHSQPSSNRHTLSKGKLQDLHLLQSSSNKQALQQTALRILLS